MFRNTIECEQMHQKRPTMHKRGLDGISVYLKQNNALWGIKTSNQKQ